MAGTGIVQEFALSGSSSVAIQEAYELTEIANFGPTVNTDSAGIVKSIAASGSNDQVVMGAVMERDLSPGRPAVAVDLQGNIIPGGGDYLRRQGVNEAPAYVAIGAGGTFIRKQGDSKAPAYIGSGALLMKPQASQAPKYL